MTDLERAQMELAAANLQLLMARGVIVDLLKEDTDWADRQVHEANALEWLEKNRLSHEATLDAFGALLDGRGE